jgi:hypothetical protein
MRTNAKPDRADLTHARCVVRTTRVNVLPRRCDVRMNERSIGATASAFGTHRYDVQVDANVFVPNRRILRVKRRDVASAAWSFRSNMRILRPNGCNVTSNECIVTSNECIVCSNERIVASAGDDVTSADHDVVMDGDAVIVAARRLHAERRDVRSKRCKER